MFYPPNTTYGQQLGFLHSLNEHQLQCLAGIQLWFTQNFVKLNDLSLFSTDVELVLLRYLRANAFNVNKAIDHISRNIAWRKENNVNELVTRTPEDILGCSMTELLEVFPHWHSGYDKTGRPVMYKQYGRFVTEKMKSITSMAAIITYHIWEQETCAYILQRQSQTTGYIVETVTAVLDVQGMTVSMVNSDFIALTKSIANMDQSQYPETLGRIFIINTPSAFPWVWRGVRPFLDPAVTAKIVVASHRSQWEPLLLDFIGEDNLPANYGDSSGQREQSVIDAGVVISSGDMVGGNLCNHETASLSTSDSCVAAI